SGFFLADARAVGAAAGGGDGVAERALRRPRSRRALRRSPRRTRGSGRRPRALSDRERSSARWLLGLALGGGRHRSVWRRARDRPDALAREAKEAGTEARRRRAHRRAPTAVATGRRARGAAEASVGRRPRHGAGARPAPRPV